MNLNITDISNLDRPNTWREAIVAWLGNAENGITSLFAKDITAENVDTKTVGTEKICIGDAGNQTCLSKDQLDRILQQSGSSASSGTPAPVVQPDDSAVSQDNGEEDQQETVGDNEAAPATDTDASVDNSDQQAVDTSEQQAPQDTADLQTEASAGTSGESATE
jgi:hypothetical protein